MYDILNKWENIGGGEYCERTRLCRLKKKYIPVKID